MYWFVFALAVPFFTKFMIKEAIKDYKNGSRISDVIIQFTVFLVFASLGVIGWIWIIKDLTQ